MRNFFNFLKNILVVISAALVLLFISNEIYFLDKKDFTSPLDENIELVIRGDSYGEGHFGARRKGGRKHTGIDLVAEVGTNVCAVKSGWVVAARQSPTIGKHVELYHKNGLITVYGHLDTIEVKVLERVKQGQVIGTVGKTGNANYKRMQTHLHFTIIKDEQYQDPAQFLPGFE